MSGIGAKLPLVLDADDGAYKLTKTLPEEIKQNLKMIVLTAKGERIMDPNFGVGLKSYLFENVDDGLLAQIAAEIRAQVAKYLPVVNVLDVVFKTRADDSDFTGNFLSVKLYYKILPLAIDDSLDVITQSQ